MLTERQLQVIDLASQGLKQAEIADWLNVSQRQIYRLMKAAREDLNARTNHELIAKSIAEGYLGGRDSDGRG